MWNDARPIVRWGVLGLFLLAVASAATTVLWSGGGAEPTETRAVAGDSTPKGSDVRYVISANTVRVEVARRALPRPETPGLGVPRPEPSLPAQTGPTPSGNTPSEGRSGSRQRPSVPEFPEAPPDDPPQPAEEPSRVEPSSDDPWARVRFQVPVEGVAPSELTDTFDDPRSGGRIHRAMDVMAPRGTPILAVTDGVIRKLFTSDLGGVAIYQVDEDERLCFYYAHLDRYARGLEVGERVRRGQQIGTVGSTGNASDAAPHLHFAVYRLGRDKQCWRGEPIDPLPFFQGP